MPRWRSIQGNNLFHPLRPFYSTRISADPSVWDAAVRRRLIVVVSSDSQAVAVGSTYSAIVAFEDELREVQEERERSSELEAERVERERELLAEAGVALGAAVETLQKAAVATVIARTAHKDRGNWKWPTGRVRVEGWWMQCGDAGVMLRTDGWLAAAHRCNDPKQTPCACPFSSATSAVPAGIYLPGAADDGKPAPELTIRTTVDGEVQDLGFNRWLAEQVANLLAAK